ncbi:hypothetical protein ABZU75_22855, partial [Streptosporangium sp. NPDC005286]|uniref:hypothetical protein n=1 Tax=Streptosporangium sp. NPDC005286 TaxID=3154463 RepID=UPI0033B3A4F8
GPWPPRHTAAGARRLDQAEETVRDLLALRFDIDDPAVTARRVTVVPVLGEELAAEVCRLPDDAVSRGDQAGSAVMRSRASAGLALSENVKGFPF